MKLAIFTSFIVLFLSGCQTTAPVKNTKETPQDVQEALTAVAGALGGKTLSEKEARDLEKQIRSDKQAQTAIQAVTESVSGKAAAVKYCPVGGERYASYLEICPEHRVPLKPVDP